MKILDETLVNEDLYSELTNLDTKDIPLFGLDGAKFNAKCVEVYDGDSITIAIYVFNNFYKFKVRLLEINSPEIRTRDLVEKTRGIFARDYLRNKILHKMIIIECGKFDKYGRLLGTIFIEDEDISINQQMIDGGHAVPY